MAKRFIQTELFRNPWLRVAKPLHKVLWVALITECDHAGIWIVDWQMMSLLCGAEIDESEARDFLDGRFVEIDAGRRWFFPDFIRYQYPNGVVGDNFNMKSIRAIFLKYGINPENLTISNPYIRVQQGLDKGCQTLKDKDKEIEEEIEMDRGVQGGNFDGVNIEEEVAQFIETFGVGQKRHQTERTYVNTIRYLTNPSGGMGYRARDACLMLRQKAASYRAFCIAVNQIQQHPPKWLSERGYMTDWNQELVNQREIQKGKNENGSTERSHRERARAYTDAAKRVADESGL